MERSISLHLPLLAFKTLNAQLSTMPVGLGYKAIRIHVTQRPLQLLKATLRRVSQRWVCATSSLCSQTSVLKL